MTREEKMQWMAVWAAKNGCALALQGEVGFGRPCVGVHREGNYLAYYWTIDRQTYESCDNGDVWQPANAYHKDSCVAVLGHGEAAEAQLYEWLQWFDANGYTVEVGDVDLPDDGAKMIRMLMSQHRYARLVKPAVQTQEQKHG